MMGKTMGIDYGAVRIGIAVSDESETIAFGREAIDNNHKTLEKIENFISEEKVTKIILGYPLNLKGERTPQTIEVESFEEKLKKFLNDIPVVRWDERFTSKMAADSMFESGMKKKNRRDKRNLDIISAALLLQSYLDSRKKMTSSPSPLL